MSLYLDSFSGPYEQKVTQLYQAIKICRNKAAPEVSLRQFDAQYDYTSSFVKKRVAATVSYRLVAHRMLGNIASAARLEDMMAFSNGLILRGGYTTDDIVASVILASAIWILDQLQIQGCLEEIYPYLPTLDDNDSFIQVHHPQYDDELIYALIKLIYFRNEESYGTVDWNLPVLSSAKGKSEPRKAYDAVIAFIDENAIHKVKQEYERKVWEFYRLTFACAVKMQDEEDRIKEEIESLKKTIMHSAPVLMRNPGSLFDIENPTTEKIQNLSYRLEQLQKASWFTEIGLPDSREKTTRIYKDIIDEKTAEDLRGFLVDDPFDAAFALHILLDEDSLLPWLYYGSICVTYTFVDQLPFVNLMADKGAPKLINDINNMLYAHKFKGIRFKGSKDCYREAVERTFGKNLSQILYYSTHTLYPRVADEMLHLESFFEDISIENDNEKALYELLIHLLGSTNKEQESLQAYRLGREIEKIAEENTVAEPAETTNLEKAVMTLQGRVDALSRALYEETRLKKNAIAKSSRLESENERLIRELADLRELVFMQQSAESIEPDTEKEIKFPVKTPGHIISFGGHPNWIREMKKLLPNVTFYSPEIVPNKDVIKNADQVWVQTQVISHSAFYRIESALGENTRLRYFTSQNVRSCAEKMAKALLKEK